jgi:ATP-binding cassette, subfamily B, bacterial PglK
METVVALWSLLTAPQRRAAFVLLGLMLCAMLLEMLGIGMVVPALAFMVQDTAITDSPWVRAQFEWLGRPSQTQLILGGLTLLLVIYAIKSGFLLFVAYWQFRFVAAIQSSMSRSLFTTYLTQPWTFHLQRNSADLIRNVENIQMVAITSAALISLVTELLVLAGIVLLLLWFEPTGAILVGLVLGVSTYAYDTITRARLARWGERRHIHQRECLQLMQEGLGGAKDVKVLGCEQQFVQRFASNSAGLAQMTGRQSWFQQIPRMWYEMLAVAALCLLTAVLIWQGKPLHTFVPTLGLFATAAFRMLPSVNRLAVSVQQIRWAKAVINSLKQEAKLAEPPAPTPRGTSLPFHKSIHLDKVSYRYSGSDTNSLTDITLTIPHGASIGVIGGSGAGKSTLVDVILGLLPPTAGQVLVDGVDIRDNTRAWLNLVGYVPQSIFLADDTLRRNVAFGLPDEKIDDSAVSRALAAAQLDGFIATLPNGLDTTVGERGVRLSGGQRQRIGIARALYYDPAVLVLDEATSALDNDTERGVMAAVNSLHGIKTLIIVAHRLTTVADCDMLYRLECGKVVRAGAFSDIVH